MNADVKMLCQDQKKWKKKHKIEATDVKNKRQRHKNQKINGWGFLLLTDSLPVSDLEKTSVFIKQEKWCTDK